MKRERRRKRVVDSFQWKFAYRIGAYWFLYQFGLWNLLFCWQLIRHGRGNLIDQYTQFTYDFWPMAACFLLFVPVFTWDAIKLFHHVAGPVCRFRKTVQDVTAHRPVRLITLRKNDELLALRDDLNAMLVELARVGAVQFVEQDVHGIPAMDLREGEYPEDQELQELCHVSE